MMRGNSTQVRSHRSKRVLEQIGERIREEREGYGLTRAQLAAECDVREDAITKAEEGLVLPVLLLVDIATVLDTTLDELVPIEVDHG